MVGPPMIKRPNRAVKLPRGQVQRQSSSKKLRDRGKTATPATTESPYPRKTWEEEIPVLLGRWRAAA
jgi:hypothetical protein